MLPSVAKHPTLENIKLHFWWHAHLSIRLLRRALTVPGGNYVGFLVVHAQGVHTPIDGTPCLAAF